jgi:hypothetical protein
MPNDPADGNQESEAEKLRWNERIKLTATWLNGMSVAAIAVGGFTQLSSGFASPAGVGGVLLSSAAWGGVALVLHLMAQAVLGRLR